MRRFVLAVQGLVPERFRLALLGSPGKPSRLANGVHKVLNRLPGAEIACFQCRGVLHGYRMKIDWDRHRSFVNGTWEPAVVQAISEVVKPGMCVVDIGAHIGFYTLVLAKLVGPQGRVLAFEPLPVNFSLLCDNINLNQCSQVQAVNQALLDHACDIQADVRLQEALPGAVGFAEADHTQAIAGTAVSLDDFLDGSPAPVKFIKMDVEGAESLVLKGAAQTVKTYHPTLMIEVHHGHFPAAESPVVTQLREWRYNLRWLTALPTVAHLLAT